MSQQADLLYRQGRDLEARALCEHAIRTELSAREPDGASLADIHQLLLLVLEAVGDTAALDSARRELVRIGEKYALGPTTTGPSIQHYAARAARALGRHDEAWIQALEADRLSRERLYVNLQSLPDRRALQLTRRQEFYLELVLDLSRGGNPKTRETAWDRLVRSRGLVRAELARRRPPPGFESDTAIAGAHERWIAAQRRLAQRLVSARGSSRDSVARAVLDGLRASAEDAEGAYAQTLAGRGAKVAPAEVGLAEIRSRLRPGEALVACFESRGSLSRRLRSIAGDTGNVIAFVARGGNDAIERIEFGPSVTLRTALDPWRERLAVSPGPRARPGDRAERECRRLGRTARALTWDRMSPHLAGATDVFIVADGPLLDLPWQALPDGAKGHLVEAGPRLHLLNAERELVEPVAAVSGSLLAMGAPDYDDGATEAPVATPVVAAVVRSSVDPCASGQLPAFAPLPGSGMEAESVARAWRAAPSHEATVLIGAAATEQIFKREARGRAVIHLATHGVVASDTCAAGAPGLRGVGGVEPLATSHARRRPPRATAPQAVQAPTPSPWMARRVWLALAGANRAREHHIDENEGLLTAEEVLTLDLQGTDWVVLSACHSGLAEAWSREGTLGMRRAFDLAGARTVIASQWAVEDDATREWMQALYAARAGGATNAAAALESASRAILAARRLERRSTHPFYWAAFSASGE